MSGGYVRSAFRLEGACDRALEAWMPTCVIWAENGEGEMNGR